MPFDGTQLDETTKLLIAARERIERGWCQGEFEIGGGVCAIRALTSSYVWQEDGDPFAIEKARRRLCRATGEVFISRWNDTHTKEQVLEGFDRAIASV